MVRKIDSDALGILTKSLGLTGPGEQGTELFDGTVDQTFDIKSVARRGRTQQPREGIYTATMRNSHTDAESITNVIDVYRVGTTLAVPPYPPIMPPQFDVWLLAASIRQASGTGTLSATMAMRFPGQQGWGIQSGGQILVAQNHRLAHWDAVVSDGTLFGVLAGSEQPTAYPRLRIPRGVQSDTEITFISTSSATSAFDLQLILGVFPVALGQDGLG